MATNWWLQWLFFFYLHVDPAGDQINTSYEHQCYSSQLRTTRNHISRLFTGIKRTLHLSCFETSTATLACKFLLGVFCPQPATLCANQNFKKNDVERSYNFPALSYSWQQQQQQQIVRITVSVNFSQKKWRNLRNEWMILFSDLLH